MFQNENVACLGQYDPDAHPVSEAAFESSDTENRCVELSLFETTVSGGSASSQSQVQNIFFCQNY